MLKKHAQLEPFSENSKKKKTYPIGHTFPNISTKARPAGQTFSVSCVKNASSYSRFSFSLQNRFIFLNLQKNDMFDELKKKQHI